MTTTFSAGQTRDTHSGPTVGLADAGVRFGQRYVWSHLTLDLAPGEFLAVLGPNGSGKTTLLKALLGLQSLTGGSVRVCGERPHRGSGSVGYIPQQKSFDPELPMRGRDLVRLGLDGHRWGAAILDRSGKERVSRAIADVGATDYADAPVGLLSGGEQQRLRVAQALVGDPALLLCDEPLLSLDLRQQQAVTSLIDQRRTSAGTTVVFVTHEVNPVLPLVDRILYLVGGRWAVGTPDEVLTSERLSSLYGTEVDVLRVRDRVVVVGAPENAHSEPLQNPHHHHHGVGDDHEGGH